MRFEIKSGGVVAILFGVAALSGAVFMFGLLAGYDVGRESQSSAAQVATTYPLAGPPPTDASAGGLPGAASSAPPVNRAVTEATVASAPANPVVPVAPIRPVASTKAPVAKPSEPIARSTPPAFEPPPDLVASEPSRRSRGMESAPSGSPASEDTSPDSGGGADAADTEAPAPHAVATAAARPQPRHKPFNIQIEAAMDRGGANEMVQRLQGLGYQPHLVPAQLNGQTWYKVVIGPYPTQEAAAAAQSEMRAKYNRLYGGGASAASSRPGVSD